MQHNWLGRLVTSATMLIALAISLPFAVLYYGAAWIARKLKRE